MRVASTSMNVDPQVSADKVTESVLIHHASAPATCLRLPTGNYVAPHAGVWK